MKDFVAENNPTPQRMRGRGDEVSKTHFFLRYLVLSPIEKTSQINVVYH